MFNFPIPNRTGEKQKCYKGRAKFVKFINNHKLTLIINHSYFNSLIRS
jgi:hypothetical protein